MSKHVSEWLNAYYDGELHGHKLRLVEEHLAECEACQAELESLHGLSDLLHEVQAPLELPDGDACAAVAQNRCSGRGSIGGGCNARSVS